MGPSDRCATTGLILTAIVCALGAAPAYSQVVDVQRFSDRVLVAHVPLMGRNNVVAVSTKKGLVLIDTAVCPHVAGKLKAEIERQFGRTDWAYVINTHAHEHAGGNAVFKHVPIIGHDNLVADLKTYWIGDPAPEEQRKKIAQYPRDKADQLQKQAESDPQRREVLQPQIAFLRAVESEFANGFEVVPPTVTFSEDMTLDMGDVTLQAMYFGRGHSLSDVVVSIPEEKVLVAGGACHPFFVRLGDAVRVVDMKRSIAVLDRVLNAGVERVVAGHAEVFGRAVVERKRDYYRDLLAGVTSAHGQGLTLEKAQAQLSLYQRFPYMRDVEVRQGTREEVHAANVATVWKLVAQQ